MKAHTIDEAAKLLVKKLRVGRRDGTITPEHPLKGRELADDWNKKFGDDVTDVDVREWANHARGVLGLPIYSDSNGYAWCLSEQEWKRTKAHLLSRIKKIQAAATKPDTYWAHINQERVFDDNHVRDVGTSSQTIREGHNEQPERGFKLPAALDAFLEEGGATVVPTDEEGLPLENRME